MRRLSTARTCYDHLAGVFAVRIADGLVDRGSCERHDSGFAITPHGIEFFRAFDIDVPRLLRNDRPFVKACIDWTERRQHISGALGKAMLQYMLDESWFQRGDARRSLDITAFGREQLRAHFAIDFNGVEEKSLKV
jgi:hypothetical protein